VYPVKMCDGSPVGSPFITYYEAEQESGTGCFRSSRVTALNHQVRFALLHFCFANIWSLRPPTASPVAEVHSREPCVLATSLPDRRAGLDETPISAPSNNDR
jgi:hypothetical protein